MKKKEELENLKQECQGCMKCELGKTRNNIVFSDGNPETAKAILIGEAPGENEDKTAAVMKKMFMDISGEQIQVTIQTIIQMGDNLKEIKEYE